MKLFLTIQAVYNLLPHFIGRPAKGEKRSADCRRVSFLKININTIPEEGMNLNFDRTGEWFRQLVNTKLRPLAAEDAGDFLLQRLDFSCMVRKIGDNIYVEGIIKVNAEIPCGR